MSKPAFREAWQKLRNEEDYYTGFVRFMDEVANIEGTQGGGKISASKV